MIEFILLFIGLLLVYLEFYLPGGIVGGTGALILLAGIVRVALNSNNFAEIVLYTLGTIVGALLVIKLALTHIRSTGKKGSIFLDSDQSGYKASSFDQDLIGKTGIALADMRPGGYVRIEGKKYQALSLSGFIAKQAEVTVVSGQGESLQVKLRKKETKL